ncbi:MAG: GAF domain-containing protein [Chloroflexi bacterium]|nr:GAF domain-containing protein [Chloroflexota bacterium]
MEPTPAPSPDLGGQLSQLGKLAGDIRTLLAAQSAAPPPAALSGLKQLSGSLADLGRLAAGQSQELKQLQALSTISQVVNSSLDLTTVLNEVMDTIIRLSGAERGFLMLRDERGELDLRVARGISPDSQQPEFEISRTIVENVAREGQAILTTNAQDDPRFDRQMSVVGYNLRSVLCVPLKVKGQLTGVIYADNRVRTGVFSAKERDLLATFANQAAVALENARLFEALQQSHLELTRAYDTTLEGWSRALDLRDEETEGHTQRVTEITVRLARATGIDGEALVQVRRGALLHDIGKMGIPDGVLRKPGPLSDDEWAIMRRHPGYAYELLAPIGYLRPALEIPYCHHEKWDGSGYPRGLAGEAIPLAARLFAVVDVWDALRSDRPYRQAWPAERVREHIQRGSGEHFDPRAVRSFLDLTLI